MKPSHEDRPMKLRATDADDLQVLAAHLQDAIVPVSEMAYLPAEQRFVLVANRFRWEAMGEAPEPAAEAETPDDAAFAAGSRFERIHCGLRVERVRAVRRRGFDPRERGAMLALLTVAADPVGAIELVFAGGAAIRLEVEAIDCFVEDLGESWPTQWRPRHEGGEGAGA
jgi:hypothetical protein